VAALDRDPVLSPVVEYNCTGYKNYFLGFILAAVSIKDSG